MAILRLPALIDPHVHAVETNPAHFSQLAKAAQQAGYAALQAMPDLDPPIIDKLTVAHYQQAMQHTAIPIYLTASANESNIEEIKQLRNVNAIKVWLGTGPEDLVVMKEEILRQVLLSTEKIVMVHAEDELTLLRNYDYSGRELTIDKHQEIYDRRAAIRATIKAITAAKETNRRIYICHVSTGEEIELIRAAKNRGIRVYAEVAPHHLFMTEKDVKRLGNRAKVNPPLRTAEDQKALWQGITDGTIDTIGSDTHAWVEKEKTASYSHVPAGLPNLELTLPLLLSAVKEGRLDFKRVIELTSTNPAKIFSIPKPTRSVFVDMDTPRPIHFQLTDWQPYDVENLVGWPVLQKEQQRTS